MSDIEKNNIAFGEIANALKSSASDHILGIAEDIYDSDLKKYQSEINSELSNKNFDDKYAPISHTHTKSQITDFAHTHDYLPLTGGALTGPITFNGSDADRNVIRINCTTGDANKKSYYGYTLKYLGSGTGINNALALYADNSEASTQTLATKWLNDGTMYTQSIIPHSTKTYDLGSSTVNFNNIYAGHVYIGGTAANTTSKITSDATTNMYFDVGGVKALLLLNGSDKTIRSGASIPNTVNLGSSTVPFKSLYVNDAHFSKALTLTGISQDTACINFSRSTDVASYGYNYITAPTNGIISIAPGVSPSSTTGYHFTSTEIKPGATNTYSLGTSSLQFKNVYGTTIYENGTSLANKYQAKGSYAKTNSTATTAVGIASANETGIYYVNGTSDVLGQADGVLITNKYSDSWISQIYQDYRTGKIALRGKNNGTWMSWLKPSYEGHTHDNVYKSLQTPVTDPVANSTATEFISSITQDTNGVISAEKKTVPTMTGATASSAGLIGLVPAPAITNRTQFLKGDGSWATPANATTSVAGFMSAADKIKLNGIAEGAEVNVQSDWNETNSSSDAFIKNKPANNVIYNTHTNGQVAKFDTTTGTITASGYTISKSVPSNAVFTDYQTTLNGHYSPSNGSIMSAMDSGQALSFGNSVITSISTDAKGHITNITTSNLPENPNIDTKNTAGSTDSFSKLFLIGAASQAAYTRTYSHDTAYVGADGCLYSNSTKVITSSDTVTTTADGIMTSEDKAKLDDSFRKCTMTVELGGSVCSAYPIAFNVDEGESTSAPKIGEKFRVKIVNNSSNNTNIFMCAKTLNLIINNSNYYIKFFNDYDLNYDLTDVKYLNNDLFTNFPTNGYIEFGIFKTKANVSIPVSQTSSKLATLYCAFLISNSYAGSISNISYASIRTDQLNTYNAPKSIVNKYYLPVLERGATGTDASNATPHIVWTDSTYYLSYNTDAETVTSVNAPSFISSGPSAFSSYTNITGIFDVKDTSNKNNVIRLNGSTSSAVPYIDICKAGDASINAIKLTGSTSSDAPSISIKNAGAATESIKLTGSTSSAAPSISIKAKNSTNNGIILTGRNGSTAAKIVVYSGTGGTCTITGGSTSISSDERLKDFTNDIDIDFDKLKQIPKKYFTWKHDDEKVLNIGTSAQVVEKIYPEIVDENLNEDDGTFYKSVDYSKLSIIALAAIDKLNERIEYLENKLKEYEQA